MHYTAEHSVENLLFVARNLIKAKASSLQIKRAPPRPLIRMSFSSRNDACAFSLDDCERPCKLSGRGGRHDKIGINSSSGRPKAALVQARHRKGRQCCFRGDAGSFGTAGQSGTKGLWFVHCEGAVRATGQKSKDGKRG